MWSLRPLRVGAMLGVLAVLPACSLMPTSGPSNLDIEAGRSSQIPYALVALTPETVSTLNQIEPKGLAGIFGQRDRRPPTAIKFGIGDVVSVTIFEAAAGGLF